MDPNAHSLATMLRGMVILMLPAFLICTGVAVLAYRKRHTHLGE